MVLNTNCFIHFLLNCFTILHDVQKVGYLSLKLGDFVFLFVYEVNKDVYLFSIAIAKLDTSPYILFTEKNTGVVYHSFRIVVEQTKYSSER